VAVRVRLEIARIISGGQTGADRAALDFAIAHHVPYGGWCPRGGWAEDRPIPPGVLAQYPCLTETPAADLDQRTAWNVRDSAATLILTQRPESLRSHGTGATERAAVELARPFAVVNLLDPEGAQALVDELLHAMPAACALNIAGPRESEAPGIYARSRRLLDQLLCDQAHGEGP
jgi:Circularly permutated YpsA SLOG family